MGRVVEGLGIKAHILRLKPDSRHHSRLPDDLGSVRQTLGEQGLGGNPVPQGVVPGLVLRLVPPGVNDKVGDGLAPEGFHHGSHLFLRGASPGGAVFIIQYGQPLFPPGSFLHGGGQHLGGFQNGVPLGDGEHRLRGLESLSREKLLPPMAQLVVCQSAGQTYPVIEPGDFYLPGAGVIQLTAPEHPILSVLQKCPGKIAVAGHGTGLTEPHIPQPKPGPGGL